ncbi:MAG: sigma-54 dependent transcriptional regulator [Pirellula sp.]|jgi:DNA-binding NtrC family response regulator|nr:sigma-54 dependent transcriptional regulator [Pirellula sp.]
MKRVLIADDEPLFARTTAQYLCSRGFDASCVGDGLQALEVLKRGETDVLIADLDMPGNRQLELLHAWRSHSPRIPFIVVTGRPTIPSAIEGIRLGIQDYFLKPLDLDDLVHSIQRTLPIDKKDSTNDFAEILGSSQAIQNLKQLAGKVANSNASVLVRGESGTGKELLAKGIHKCSQRKDAPFITIDCASIPDSLVESVLFGHVKGAFTGAISDRPGQVRMANHGTLFLDEIGELPMLIQSKLLRMIQFGTFTPVGDHRETKVNVRIVAATNRNLKREIEKGNFRLDLFYRLAVLEIVIAPLRDRISDIPELAGAFVQQIALRDRMEIKQLSLKALDYLMSYSWPGNVRELVNIIERCMCLSDGSIIDLDDVQAAIDQNAEDSHASEQKIGSDVSQDSQSMGGQPPFPISGDASKTATLEQAERVYFQSLLKQHAGNVSQAAREASMTRQGFHKALTRLGIDQNKFRGTRD